MIQTFACPSCGATLSYEGGLEPTITCQFCGATVRVPGEVRKAAAVSATIRPTVANAPPPRLATANLLAAAIGLILMLFAGIAGLLLVTTSTRTAALPPNSTAAPARGAADLDATQGAVARETAIVEATQAVESFAATATAQAEAAANATATADTQQLATRMAADQAGWSPFTLDAFDTNANGWPLGADGDEYIGIDTALQEGRYVWTVTPHQGNSYWNIFSSRTKDFADFYASVDLRLNSGGEGGGYAYGLVFRHVNDDYGFFGIQNDGAFRLLVVYGTGVYQHYITTSSAIRTEPGQVNHIAVRASGPDFIFLINDEVVWRLNEDFPAGEIGLGVDVLSANGEAQARFDNFEVRAP